MNRELRQRFATTNELNNLVIFCPAFAQPQVIFVPIIAKNKAFQRAEFSVIKTARYGISTRSLIRRHLHPQANFFYPFPVFRCHLAGARAGDWVCAPVLHRVGGFEQCVGEVYAGEVPVRELARLVHRDVKRVHEDAAELVKLGLIERTERGGLVCPYLDIHIDMHMRRAV